MFDKRLRKLRTSKNLSQQDIANLVNKTQQAVNLWEKGENEPGHDILIKLADYFDVSVDYLLGRTDDPSPQPKIETMAGHRTDDPMSELPEEARKSVEEFIDYVYQKYKGKN